MAAKNLTLPELPRKDFPLRPHRNGQWYKSVWNPRTKKSEQFYFGTWQDDRKGERALHDPQIGWLARRDAIRAGVDNAAVLPVSAAGMTLGELMTRFLTFKRAKTQSGELSLTTLGDYLREVEAFSGPSSRVGAHLGGGGGGGGGVRMRARASEFTGRNESILECVRRHEQAKRGNSAKRVARPSRGA